MNGAYDESQGLYHPLKDPNSNMCRVLKTVGKTDAITARLLLLEAYDTDYGIHNHLLQYEQEKLMFPDQKRPLSLVAMHPAEITSGAISQRAKLMRTFTDLKISASFGMDWVDFINQPVEEVEEMLRCARSGADREANIQSGILNQINAESKIGKK